MYIRGLISRILLHILRYFRGSEGVEVLGVGAGVIVVDNMTPITIGARP